MEANSVSTDLALWRERDVLGVYRVSRSYFRQEIRDGQFPKPIKRGKLSFWKRSDVLAHLAKIAGGSA